MSIEFIEMVKMDIFFTMGVVFSRLGEKVAPKPTHLPFGDSLSGVIWLFRKSHDLIDILVYVHLSISPSSSEASLTLPETATFVVLHISRSLLTWY